MESSSNSSSTEEFDQFLDAPDEFYYDCMPNRFNSNRQHSYLSRRRKSTNRRDLIDFEIEKEPSSSSDNFESGGKSSCMERDSETKDDIDVTESINYPIDVSSEKENNVDVVIWSEAGGKIMDETDSDLSRVDPFQVGNCMSGEITEESTVTTVSDDQGDDYARSAPQLREPNIPDWSLLGFLVGLLIKTIEFQVSLMTSVLTFPPWFLHYCFLLFCDPFRTISFARRFLMARGGGITDMIFGTMKPFRLSWFKETKGMLNTVSKCGWGLLWAVYVGIVLFGLFVSALMLGGYMINSIADKPFVVKEILNFDYTKNSPEAYVPISSCVGVACDESCMESNEMLKIRGLQVIPRGQKLDITLSMTLPESAYNKNLGMFQVRVDFLAADGQTISSIRRPCMLRFRSEPIRLIQTFFRVVPLVTGYVSEIQTLSLKLKGFVERDIPTAFLKVMLEQRAEFRPGAGIPELYDASLSVESDLPFFKKLIWNWRKTLFVWISMSLFGTELLFALVCYRPLILPRTRRRDRSPSNTVPDNGVPIKPLKYDNEDEELMKLAEFFD